MPGYTRLSVARRDLDLSIDTTGGRLIRSILLAVLTAFALGAAALAQPPEVLIDAPSDLEVPARHLRQWRSDRLATFQQLIGLPTSGQPIRVVLLTEDSVPASAMPSWVAGYAQADDLIVLFPARVPVYPNSSLDELLGHEVAHVLIARAAGRRAVPRWFNEGLAMLAEEAWDWGDRSRAALALIRSEDYGIATVDQRFGGTGSEVSSAYALSAAFVRSLVGRHGKTMPADVLARLAAGQSFESAFAAATGETLEEAEAFFWRRQALWTRWIPLLGSPTTLWILITLLALWAIKRRRDRDRDIEAAWDAEERFVEPGPDEPLN